MCVSQAASLNKYLPKFQTLVKMEQLVPFEKKIKLKIRSIMIMEFERSVFHDQLYRLIDSTLNVLISVFCG